MSQSRTKAIDELVEHKLAVDHVVGRVVQIAEIGGKPITELSLTELQAIHPTFEEDVAEALTIEGSLKARNVVGGTGFEAVKKQITHLNSIVNA